MKKNKKLFLMLLVALCAIFMFSMPVSAAKYKNQFVKAKNGRMYYYNKDGKKVTGVKKIRGKYYYFDSNGRQRNGWIKYKNNYYFFRIGNCSSGYRLQNTKVNGIKLYSNGKAQLTSYNKRKLALMVRANDKMFELTNANMTKAKKLRVAFDYAKNGIRSRNIGGFRDISTWDLFYAEYAFNTGTADCYGQGACFAYLANAIGYKAHVVSSTGHGWCEIGNKVYDPNCALWLHTDPDFYAMDINLSGVGGRPNYKHVDYRRIII